MIGFDFLENNGYDTSRFSLHFARDSIFHVIDSLFVILKCYGFSQRRVENLYFTLKEYILNITDIIMHWL